MAKAQALWRRAAAGLLALALAAGLAGCAAGSVPAVSEPAVSTPAATDPPPAPIEGVLNIERIDGLAQDFMMGWDISSLPAELASGVTYYDYAGNALTDIPAFCRFLADEVGITHVRVRVWVDPHDAAGHGYGGGNNDTAAAVAIAEGCAAAGLKMLVDFHASDFWADPAKQQPPKAWAGFTLEEKAAALQSHIADTLAAIADTGAEVDLVQVGNETTNAFIGESDPAAMCALYKAGIEAVHAAGARAVIHLTNPEKGTMTYWAAILDEQGVDYDVLATSYYPTWHGSLDNLTAELTAVRETYGKDVLVAETAYASTMEDSDGHPDGGIDGEDLLWPFTPQGQATYMREVMAAAQAAGALGVFYWEPAWITVGDTTDLHGADYEAQVAANAEKWEEFGSGWAASYARDYDPDDAGQWYGGSAVDNQAFFGADGQPLDSLHVYRYVYTGAVTDRVSVEQIGVAAVTVAPGTLLTADDLPATVTVLYNDGTTEESPVEWDADEIAGVYTDAPGEGVITGTVAFVRVPDSGLWADRMIAAALCEVTVAAAPAGDNLLPAAAAGFESGDGYELGGEGISPIPAGDDPYEGEGSLHWWSESVATTGTATYTGPLTLAAGRYRLSAQAQGLEGDAVTLEVLAADGTVLFSSEPAVLAGWANWQQPAVEFTLESETAVMLRVSVAMQIGGWGTVDCLELVPAA